MINIKYRNQTVNDVLERLVDLNLSDEQVQSIKSALESAFPAHELASADEIKDLADAIKKQFGSTELKATIDSANDAVKSALKSKDDVAALVERQNQVITSQSSLITRLNEKLDQQDSEISEVKQLLISAQTSRKEDSNAILIAVKAGHEATAAHFDQKIDSKFEGLDAGLAKLDEQISSLALVTEALRLFRDKSLPGIKKTMEDAAADLVNGFDNALSQAEKTNEKISNDTAPMLSIVSDLGGEVSKLKSANKSIADETLKGFRTLTGHSESAINRTLNSATNIIESSSDEYLKAVKVLRNAAQDDIRTLTKSANSRIEAGNSVLVDFQDISLSVSNMIASIDADGLKSMRSDLSEIRGNLSKSSLGKSQSSAEFDAVMTRIDQLTIAMESMVSQGKGDSS